MRPDPTQAALARLDDILLHTPEGRSAFVKALSAKSNLVVAKAARIIGNAQWLELRDELTTVANQLIDRGGEGDKGCTALLATCRALVAMDHDVPDLYLRGIRYVQQEPGWGGASDTAVDVRSTCAMGLVNSSHLHKLRDLVPLLVDPAWGARAGAIRAISVVGSEAASLLVRFKMLAGDRDTEVMSECFSAMLAMEGAEGVKLVSRFVGASNSEIQEAAILALGASRRSDAIDLLKASAARVGDPTLRKIVLLALSTSRTEAAIDFLLQLVETGPVGASNDAKEALDLHREDRALQERLQTALRARALKG